MDTHTLSPFTYDVSATIKAMTLGGVFQNDVILAPIKKFGIYKSIVQSALIQERAIKRTDSILQSDYCLVFLLCRSGEVRGWK